MVVMIMTILGETKDINTKNLNLQKRNNVSNK